jgi:hypothetical protein
MTCGFPSLAVSATLSTTVQEHSTLPRFGAPSVVADPSVADLVRSFELHPRAKNKAGHTIETYLDALRLAAGFLAAQGVELEQARREDVEAFIADQLARWTPATAANLDLPPEAGHLG